MAKVVSSAHALCRAHRDPHTHTCSAALREPPAAGAGSDASRRPQDPQHGLSPRRAPEVCPELRWTPRFSPVPLLCGRGRGAVCLAGNGTGQGTRGLRPQSVVALLGAWRTAWLCSIPVPLCQPRARLTMVGTVLATRVPSNKSSRCPVVPRDCSFISAGSAACARLYCAHIRTIQSRHLRGQGQPSAAC